jgi:hypothetical protein
VTVPEPAIRPKAAAQPGREAIGVFCSRTQEPGEIPDVGGKLGYFEAGAGEPGQEIVMFDFEVVGPGEEHADEPARGDVAAAGAADPPGLKVRSDSVE